MRLEDALLYLIVDEADGISLSTVPDVCRAAIRGGVDAVQLAWTHRDGDDLALARQAAQVCREADALFLVRGDAALARELGADGVHMSGPDEAIGLARSMLNESGLVGMSSRSAAEAALALELGVDYLVHFGGAESRQVFEGLGGRAGVPLFAGGIEGVEEAREVVETGVYRLCIDWRSLGRADVGGQMAAYSRLLGRSL